MPSSQAAAGRGVGGQSFQTPGVPRDPGPSSPLGCYRPSSEAHGGPSRGREPGGKLSAIKAMGAADLAGRRPAQGAGCREEQEAVLVSTSCRGWKSLVHMAANVTWGMSKRSSWMCAEHFLCPSLPCRDSPHWQQLRHGRGPQLTASGNEGQTLSEHPWAAASSHPGRETGRILESSLHTVVPTLPGGPWLLERGRRQSAFRKNSFRASDHRRDSAEDGGDNQATLASGHRPVGGRRLRVQTISGIHLGFGVGSTVSAYSGRGCGQPHWSVSFERRRCRK